MLRARAKSIHVAFRLRAQATGWALTDAIANDLVTARQIRLRLSGKHFAHPVVAAAQVAAYGLTWRRKAS